MNRSIRRSATAATEPSDARRVVSSARPPTTAGPTRKPRYVQVVSEPTRVAHSLGFAARPAMLMIVGAQTAHPAPATRIPTSATSADPGERGECRASHSQGRGGHEHVQSAPRRRESVSRQPPDRHRPREQRRRERARSPHRRRTRARGVRRPSSARRSRSRRPSRRAGRVRAASPGTRWMSRGASPSAAVVHGRMGPGLVATAAVTTRADTSAKTATPRRVSEADRSAGSRRRLPRRSWHAPG